MTSWLQNLIAPDTSKVHGADPRYPVTTETEEEGQFAERFPVPVHLASQAAELTRQDAADKASYTQIPNIGASNPGPFQVLPYSPDRHRAIIYCTGTTAQFLLNKSLAALQATPPIGFQINNGTMVVLENIEPLYVLYIAGTATTFSVIEERWITEPKE